MTTKSQKLITEQREFDRWFKNALNVDRVVVPRGVLVVADNPGILVLEKLQHWFPRTPVFFDDSIALRVVNELGAYVRQHFPNHTEFYSVNGVIDETFYAVPKKRFYRWVRQNKTRLLKVVKRL